MRASSKRSSPPTHAGHEANQRSRGVSLKILMSLVFARVQIAVLLSRNCYISRKFGFENAASLFATTASGHRHHRTRKSLNAVSRKPLNPVTRGPLGFGSVLNSHCISVSRFDCTQHLHMYTLSWRRPSWTKHTCARCRYLCGQSIGRSTTHCDCSHSPTW